jgi:hypothetical protein
MLRVTRCGIHCSMSHSDSKPSGLQLKSALNESGTWPTVPVLAPPTSADAALDAALSSVSLPDGLLARLNVLVAVMPDEVTDHADWLGC